MMINIEKAQIFYISSGVVSSINVKIDRGQPLMADTLVEKNKFEKKKLGRLTTGDIFLI